MYGERWPSTMASSSGQTHTLLARHGHVAQDPVGVHFLGHVGHNRILRPFMTGSRSGPSSSPCASALWPAVGHC